MVLHVSDQNQCDTSCLSAFFLFTDVFTSSSGLTTLTLTPETRFFQMAEAEALWQLLTQHNEEPLQATLQNCYFAPITASQQKEKITYDYYTVLFILLFLVLE